LKLTASFGLCMVAQDTPLKQTIEFADQALYLAKTEGRNRLKLWSESTG